MATEAATLLFDAIGEVKLGDTVLPGLYQSLRVRREVHLEEKKVPGRSGKTKQPLGFGDAEISLRLAWVTDDIGTALQKMTATVAVFQAQDQQARPHVYTVAHPLLAAWGIRTVVFSTLTVEDDNTTDTITGSLELVEHHPVTLQAERRRPRPAAASIEAAAGGTYYDMFGEGYSVLGDPATFDPRASRLVEGFAGPVRRTANLFAQSANRLARAIAERPNDTDDPLAEG
jgi:hypothetical protein